MSFISGRSCIDSSVSIELSEKLSSSSCLDCFDRLQAGTATGYAAAHHNHDVRENDDPECKLIENRMTVIVRANIVEVDLILSTEHPYIALWRRRRREGKCPTAKEARKSELTTINQIKRKKLVRRMRQTARATMHPVTHDPDSEFSFKQQTNART